LYSPSMQLSRFLSIFLAALFCVPYPAIAGVCPYEIARGTASWYGPGFEGNRTTSGEVFYPGLLSAAHQTLPFGTIVKVTNLKNARSVNVRINDRGGFKTHVIDLSEGAAHELGMMQDGVVPVSLHVCAHR